MWKKIIGLCLALAFVALPAYAIDIQEEGSSLSEITHLNIVGDRITATNVAGGIGTITMQNKTANNVRSIQFLPGDFTIGADILDGASTPDIEEENNAACIVWDDGETTAISVTFRIPDDYSSGGAFRGLFDSSSETTFSEVDFQVYVHTGSAAWDGAATNQTPVALSVEDGTPEIVTLTVATDFASLAVGQIVALDIWRDNTAAGTDDLEMYYLEFYYNAVDNN